MQPNKTQLSSSQRLNVQPIFVSSFSFHSQLAVYGNQLIYYAGNHLVVDPLDPTQTQYTLRGHDNTVTALSVSKSGLVASGQMGSPGNSNYNSPVMLWQLSQSKPVGILNGLKEGVKGLCFSEDGTLLAGVSNINQLLIWEVKSQKQLYAKIFEFTVSLLHFNNSSLIISYGKGLQQVDINPLLSSNKPPIFTSFTLPSTGLPRSFTTLLKVGSDKYLIGTESGEICHFVKGVFQSATIVGKGKVHSLGALSNGIDIFGCVGSEAVRYEFIEGTFKQRGREEGYNGKKVCVSAKDEVFIGTLAGLKKVGLDLQARTIRSCHGAGISGVSCREGLIASIDKQGTILARKFSKNSAELLGVYYSGQDTQGMCIQVASDQSIVAGFSSGTLMGVSSDCSKTLWRINAHKGATTSIHLGENYLLSGGEDCVVRIWSAGSQQLVHQISAHQKPVSAVLGDCRYPHIVHSCSLDRSIYAYDLKADKKISFRQASNGSLTSIAQSSLTGDLVTCGPGAGVGVWKSGEHQPSVTMESANSKVLKVSINQNGSIAALGADNGDIYLYSLFASKALGVLQGHSRQVTGLAWIGERLLVSVSEDQCLCVWPIE